MAIYMNWPGPAFKIFVPYPESGMPKPSALWLPWNWQRVKNNLLPNFPGAHAVRDALKAEVKVTGATVHWVDAGIDTGAIIRQKEVTIEPEDDESTLHERIKIVERDLIVETLQNLIADGLPRRNQ